MAGEIKRLIDSIVEKRAQGNTTVAVTTRTKLVLKGIRVDNFTASSEDDPDIIRQLKQIATEMCVRL